MSLLPQEPARLGTFQFLLQKHSWDLHLLKTKLAGGGRYPGSCYDGNS